MKKIVFSFGRMNPPTKGHEKLVKKVKSLAYNADHMIYLSHTQNSVRDPLGWDYKLTLCRKAFPETNFCEDSGIKTPFQALEYLTLAMDYTDITFVVGEDRLDEFTESMTPYATGWGLEKFQVVSAGTRNYKSRSITGMSGSRLRYYAYFDDEENFCKGMPSGLDMFTKKQVFRDVKSLLKIT
jgi:hypothetical protein